MCSLLKVPLQAKPAAQDFVMMRWHPQPAKSQDCAKLAGSPHCIKCGKGFKQNGGCQLWVSGNKYLQSAIPMGCDHQGCDADAAAICGLKLQP